MQASRSGGGLGNRHANGSTIQRNLLVDPFLGLESLVEINLLLSLVPEDLPASGLRVFPNYIAVVFGLAHDCARRASAQSQRRQRSTLDDRNAGDPRVQRYRSWFPLDRIAQSDLL